MSEPYQLRCRECGRGWGNAPLTLCTDCFSPLEISYDLDQLRGKVTRESISSRAPNLWRYSDLLPLPEGFQSDLAAGFTPLVRARRLGARLGIGDLYVKNDAVCFPSLSFKDRVVAVALAAARRFGFEVVSCSSTGNLANAVAAQAARGGFEACIFIPADLEAAKILNTQVYGAKVVRIAGNYDQVNRLCSQIAEAYRWGFVNVNLRPYYAEGSKTVGYEIAEQLGWRLPDSVVVPMAGGSLIRKIAKAFHELAVLGLVEEKQVKFFGAQATGCSPISDAVKNGKEQFDPQKPDTIARSLAIGNPADGNDASKLIRTSGGWAEDVSDPEIVAGIELLAETEGIFAETAGGVTLGVTQKLLAQGRIAKGETTVVCVTGNGLKTTDALAGRFALAEPIAPKLAEFERVISTVLNPNAISADAAAAGGER
ncbi:MAG: threonine synthase [Bryobacteraceae bacterium]